jgi:hypothetical protein
MSGMEEQILKAAKEIVVKFIETGRISPTGFSETFKSVYGAIFETINGAGNQSSETEGKDQ